MKKNEFPKIWDDLILELIPKRAKDLGVRYKPMKLMKIIMLFHYKRLRKKIINIYMDENTDLIDRHKIAACVMKSILYAKPLYIPLKTKIKYIFSKKKALYQFFVQRNTNLQDDKFYIFLNEYLSIYASIHIINSYINSNEKKYHHKIVVPEPFPEPDSDYILDICLGVGYSKLKYCNVVTFANVFFLWEKYSCRKSRCDSLIDAYKELLKEYKEKIGENITNEDLDKEVEKAMLAEQYDRCN